MKNWKICKDGLWACCLLWTIATVQGQNVAQRLGYPKDAKLLIIHADDLGVAHSQDMASTKALEESPVNSASIMVPCPWFPEIAQYARKNPSTDLGLHLTLTSEWDLYKWGPVAPKGSVTSLLNTDGYFYSAVDSLQRAAKPSEVALELKAQIQKAYAAGIDVTHLDVHMGAAASTPEFLREYLKLGREYQLPILLNKGVYDVPGVTLTDKDVVLDRILSASPKDFDTDMAAFYTDQLKNMQPGLNLMIIHLAYDNEEMKGVTVNHPYWNAAWRQADYDFFTSPQCAQLLKEQGIILVTWRELRDKIVRH